MTNVVEIAKASITAYNDKNWSKVKDVLAANAVYDEKGTHRRIQGTGEIIEARQGWAKAFPDSKATFVREFASGDTAVFEVVWKGAAMPRVAIPQTRRRAPFGPGRDPQVCRRNNRRTPACRNCRGQTD